MPQKSFLATEKKILSNIKISKKDKWQSFIIYCCYHLNDVYVKKVQWRLSRAIFLLRIFRASLNVLWKQVNIVNQNFKKRKTKYFFIFKQIFPLQKGWKIREVEDQKQGGIPLFPWEVLMFLIIIFFYMDITANIPMGILHSRSLSINFDCGQKCIFRQTQSYIVDFGSQANIHMPI